MAPSIRATPTSSRMPRSCTAGTRPSAHVPVPLGIPAQHACVCHTTRTLRRTVARSLLLARLTATGTLSAFPVTEWVGLNRLFCAGIDRLLRNLHHIYERVSALRQGKHARGESPCHIGTGTLAQRREGPAQHRHRLATQRAILRSAQRMGRRTRRMHGTTSSRGSSSGLSIKYSPPAPAPPLPHTHTPVSAPPACDSPCP